MGEEYDVIFSLQTTSASIRLVSLISLVSQIVVQLVSLLLYLWKRNLRMPRRLLIPAG